MKILWVNPSFLDYRIPLYQELNKLFGGSFHLVYSKTRVPNRCVIKVNKALGANSHSLENEKCIKIGNTKSDLANTSISIPIPRGLYKQIKSVHPSIIIAEGFFQFTPWAVCYSLLHRIPLLIAYERTAHTERNCPWYRRLYRKFVNLFVNGYIVNGSLTKEYLVSQGVKAENIFTGGMCADSFDLGQSVRSLSLDEKGKIKETIFTDSISDIIYIYVGQLVERKGVKYLLEGWKQHILEHPYDKLLILGDGPLREKFKDVYDGINSIYFMGSIDYSQIFKYYAISDVFVIPTLEDNWSLVVPEAMACGLPIACSIYNGCYPELVHQGKNGITFDPKQKDSVVKALDYFHHVDLSLLGEESIKIEKEYNPEQTALNIQNAVLHYLK